MDKKFILAKDWSFEQGYYHVPYIDQKACRARIMSALELTTRVGFLTRLRGKIEPKISEVFEIEKIFEEYGITDVWGKII
ncbi:MAG: hypothetical protein LBG80_15530 [Bacteroidales bacterium]|jgi:hypothetical protein|nr:hypothetical protein [Bacteroidales bacterium]